MRARAGAGGEGGTRDNVPIPIFDGAGWRDFSRRVEAWQLAISIKPERFGPALTATLHDAAWAAVEDINLNQLAKPGGLEFLMSELRGRFEEKEVHNSAEKADPKKVRTEDEGQEQYTMTDVAVNFFGGAATKQRVL